MFGHTTLDMVKRYLSIADTDIASDHEKASIVKVMETLNCLESKSKE
jgi:hypothetical protein